MLLSPLEKGCGPLFEQTKILSNKDFGQNCYSGFRREDENVKSYQTDKWTTGNQKSSLKLSAQVSQKQAYYKYKSKASRAIMASSEENIDFMKLLYCKQSSVANPVRVGGGYQV